MVHHNLWQTAVSTPVIGLKLLYEQQNTKDQRKKSKKKDNHLMLYLPKLSLPPQMGHG